MSAFSNIWNHPRTSAAGLLIAIATIASVLSQQGISLGKAGTGTVVSLASALATALLGLLAKDPVDAQPAPGSTQRAGALMLCALLLSATMTSGCSAQSVAQDIVNWTPALQSAVATIDATAATLDPSAAPAFAAATVGFDAASNLLVAAAKAYLANQGAGTLAQLQTQVVTFQQQVNASLLQSARIMNSDSQQKAMIAINGVAAIVNSILALVIQISGKNAAAKLAAAAQIKIAQVTPYLDPDAIASIVAAHYGEPMQLARFQVGHAEALAIEEGF